MNFRFQILKVVYHYDKTRGSKNNFYTESGMEGCQILVILKHGHRLGLFNQIDINNIINKLICKAFDCRQ